jgi:hypothetical protein
MAYWNGTRWVPDTAASPPARRTYRGRLLGATTEASLIVLLVFGLMAGTAFAAKIKAQGSCAVDGNLVSATGLPTYEVLNFFVTDASGTHGHVLGITWEGWWDVTVADRTGPTTYEFAGRTYGKNGSKYDVYASCTAS